MRFTVVYFIIARWTRDMYTTEICLRKYKTQNTKKKKHKTYRNTRKRFENPKISYSISIRKKNGFVPSDTFILSSETWPYPEEHLENRMNFPKKYLDPRGKRGAHSMRDPPSELMNSFALCTPEPTRIDSISFSERRDTRSARWIAITERFTIDDTTRTDFSCVRAGLCTGNTGLAGPCPFVTVSMHFGGRASLQLSHGLTSAHLHSRRRSYIYVYISRHGHPPGSPFPSRLHPRRNIPPRERPRVRRKDEGEGRFGTRGAIHHPPLAGTENPFTDPTGTTGRECARAF